MGLSWLALLAAEIASLLGRLFGDDVLGVPRGVMLSPRRVAWLGTTGPVALVLEIAVAIAYW